MRKVRDPKAVTIPVRRGWRLQSTWASSNTPKPFVSQMREVRDPKAVTIPVLARLAVLTEDNDEMRSYFIAAGGAPRLSQLAAADHPPLKGGRQGPHIEHHRDTPTEDPCVSHLQRGVVFSCSSQPCRTRQHGSRCAASLCTSRCASRHPGRHQHLKCVAVNCSGGGAGGVAPSAQSGSGDGADALQPGAGAVSRPRQARRHRPAAAHR